MHMLERLDQSCVRGIGLKGFRTKRSVKAESNNITHNKIFKKEKKSNI